MLSRKKKSNKFHLPGLNLIRSWTVGDPLLKVVEAETREEAEYKALYMSNMANGGIVAVGGHQEDGNKSPHKKESEFSFPVTHSPHQEDSGSPRIFRGK